MSNHRPRVRARGVFLALSLAAALNATAGSDADALTAEQIVARPLFHEILGDVERQLPTDTKLHRVSMDGDVVLVQGTASDVPELILALQRSTTLTLPELQGELIPDARTGGQLFLIRTKVKLGAQSQGTPAVASGDDADSARTRMSQRITQSVKSHARNTEDCQILLLQPDHTESATSERASVTVRMRCTEETLRTVLADIEGGTPAVFLDDVQSWRQQRFQPDTGEPFDFQDVRFEAFGYLARGR